MCDFKRITPAGAGKTYSGAFPRFEILGSPPQVRGKRRTAVLGSCQHGITPAGAGKTADYCPILPELEDHPRRCGENTDCIRKFQFLPGSPPQVRGKLKRFNILTTQIRDHPRGCGENRNTQSGKNYCLGSPPRMRGKHRCTFQPSERNGITPADAGKTPFVSGCCNPCRDHPRGCGENDMAMLDEAVGAGSPPRMRGKLHPTAGTLSAFRITPADAGKTPEMSFAAPAVEDHPRGCGENTLLKPAPN